MRLANPQAAYWRRAELKAERERDAAVADAPLFAEQTIREARTAADCYWHMRRRIVDSACHLSQLRGRQALDWLEVQRRERLAARVLGSDDLAAAQASSRAVYQRRGGPEYHLDLWRRALVGKTDQLHLPAVEATQPDDGGLAELLRRTLTANANREG
jgi:hypothetical protein